MTEEKKLMAELTKAKLHLEKLWYNVAYIWIYGSQNYWLAEYSEDYMSDIDYKAVIVPNLDNLVYNSKPKSTTLIYKGGQIDLKDVRVFTEILSKCNPAYIETLYTPYSIYTDEYKKIINEREAIINEMGEFLLKASYGMIMEKIKAFDHPYPTIKHKIDKFGYDPKQLHHIVRLTNLMNNYIKTWEFKIYETNETERKLLMDIKKGSLSLEDAKLMRDEYHLISKWIKENYLIKPRFEAKNRIIQYSKDLIRKKIVDEIKGVKKQELKSSNKNNWYCPVCWYWYVIKKWWTKCERCKNNFSTLPNI